MKRSPQMQRQSYPALFFFSAGIRPLPLPMTRYPVDFYGSARAMRVAVCAYTQEVLR